jgi:hypothetical protein
MQFFFLSFDDRKYMVSQCREDINSLYHFERIPGNIPGAYVSLESEIIGYIKYHVNPETQEKITGVQGHRTLQSKHSFSLRFKFFYFP